MIKNMLKTLVVLAVLACATGASAQSPWKVQQRYQRQWQRNNPSRVTPHRHPVRCQCPKHRVQPFRGLNLRVGKFNFQIGPSQPRYCPPPFFQLFR